MRNFIFGIWEDIRTIFSLRNLRWHFLAFFLTFLAVFSGFDWFVFLHFHDSPFRNFLFAALPLGGLLPIFLPPTLILLGAFQKNIKSYTSGLALLQAAIFGSLISSFYKALSGRIHPPREVIDVNDVALSQQFHFGFLREGIFWGWPSSHTTIAFAMALALYHLFPKNKFIKFFATLYAAYVGVAVLIGAHWFSEALSGAIFGILIGVTVGKYFYKKNLSARK